MRSPELEPNKSPYIEYSISRPSFHHVRARTYTPTQHPPPPPLLIIFRQVNFLPEEKKASYVSNDVRWVGYGGVTLNGTCPSSTSGLAFAALSNAKSDSNNPTLKRGWLRGQETKYGDPLRYDVSERLGGATLAEGESLTLYSPNILHDSLLVITVHTFTALQPPKPPPWPILFFNVAVQCANPTVKDLHFAGSSQSFGVCQNTRGL